MRNRTGLFAYIDFFGARTSGEYEVSGLGPASKAQTLNENGNSRTLLDSRNKETVTKVR